MIPPSSLAFSLLEGHPCWSTCGRRTRLQMIPPSSLVISQGWGLIDLPLRASNEGLLRPRVARAQKIIRLHPLPFIVGALRARMVPGHSPPPSSFARFSSRGSSQIVLHCAHRTSTVLSCAFCEQEGWSGCSPPILLRPHFARAPFVLNGPSKLARYLSGMGAD